MKKANPESRIFSRRKARELDLRELERINGGMMPVESHSFCPGAGMDDSDVYDTP